jgi:methylase of polypeptide subunit release factors
LVQIDANPLACSDARYNARSAGLEDRVVVHCTSIAEVATWARRFPLVIADPPYIASREVARYEQDPVDAIDGGMDGLDLARACADAVIAVLAPHGRALLQLGGRRQVDAMEAWVQPDLDLVEFRSDGPDRYVALFARARDHRA